MQVDAIDAFWGDLATTVDDNYLSQSHTDNKKHVSTLFDGLLHLFKKRVCHGDIKP